MEHHHFYWENSLVRLGHFPVRYVSHYLRVTKWDDPPSELCGGFHVPRPSLVREGRFLGTVALRGRGSLLQPAEMFFVVEIDGHPAWL